MIGPFIKGFANTFKHMFKTPMTVKYPNQKVPVFPRYRGKQVLMRDENGSAQAGPRYAELYQIHKTRCIFCGFCEEACPVSAIFMGKDYELAVYSNQDFIWDKTELLVAAPNSAPATQAR
jgi:NADH-quinone oxidoreductase subunit I